MPIGRLPTSATDPDVQALCRLHNLTDQPVYVDYEDHGYEADYCHVSAKHAEITRGGKRIHGWAIWQFDSCAMAEFHSIWEDPNGRLIDVTPPKWGEAKILFVPDLSLSIVDWGNIQALYTDRSSLASHPYWHMGNPTEALEWGVPNDASDLVRYCAKLGLPDTSMV